MVASALNVKNLLSGLGFPPELESIGRAAPSALIIQVPIRLGMGADAAEDLRPATDTAETSMPTDATAKEAENRGDFILLVLDFSVYSGLSFLP
jgi:hypothetical protein